MSPDGDVMIYVSNLRSGGCGVGIGGGFGYLMLTWESLTSRGEM
jgi:hypothetical protein